MMVGKLSLSSTNSSKLYVNLDIPRSRVKKKANTILKLLIYNNYNNYYNNNKIIIII